MKKRQIRRKSVQVTLPKDIAVGLSTARFCVYDKDKKFGELQVSQGTVVWFQRDGKLGYQMKWEKFDKIMELEGYKYRTRKTRR